MPSTPYYRIVSLALAACTLSCSPRSHVSTVATTTPTAAAPERSNEERAVLAAVQGFFDSMTSKDSASAAKALDVAGDFVAVLLNDGGEPIVQRADNTGYFAGMSTRKEQYSERMWNADVRVHGAIAMVWAPYDFHIDGKFSHCGVDIFNLVKKKTGWMITSGTFTVERTGCVARPL